MEGLADEEAPDDGGCAVVDTLEEGAADVPGNRALKADKQIVGKAAIARTHKPHKCL